MPRRGNPNWTKGVSGNPRGLSTGSRHRITILAEQMISGDGEAVIQKCLDMAKKGNETALRLVVERILPAKKYVPIKFNLPEKLDTAGDISSALTAVITQTAQGDIAPDEALHAATLLEAKRKAIETSELEARLGALEKTLQTTGNRT
jgi:hypothetical protein